MDVLERAKALIAVIRGTDSLLKEARCLVASRAPRGEIIAVVRQLDDLVRANGGIVRRAPAKTGISMAAIGMDIEAMSGLHAEAVLTMFAHLAPHDGEMFEERDERIHDTLRRLMIALAIYTADILDAPSIIISEAA